MGTRGPVEPRAYGLLGFGVSDRAGRRGVRGLREKRCEFFGREARKERPGVVVAVFQSERVRERAALASAGVADAARVGTEDTFLERSNIVVFGVHRGLSPGAGRVLAG